VPALEVHDGRIAEAVARALEQHRAELAELVARQVEFELERLAGELVADALARRNGAGETGEGDRADDVSRLDTPGGVERREDTRRCSTCRRVFPSSAFGRDARTPDGLRSRCNDCRRQREYTGARRARRARRESARPTAQGPASGDDDARPDPEHAGNGRTTLSAPRAVEYAPTVDQWLVQSGFATLEHGELVATAAGAQVGAAIFT
jgi:hypothetical protein